MELLVDNSYTKINFTQEESGKFKEIVEEQLHYQLGVKEDGYIFSPAYKHGGWDGIVDFYDPKTQTFPTGLVNRVETILGELQGRIGFTYSINDDRPDAFVPLDELPDEVVLLDNNVGEITLRDYQYDAFRASFEHRMSVLHLATNAGKCVPSDTRLLTAQGYKTVEQIFKENNTPVETVEREVEGVDINLINRYGEVEEASHLTFNGLREVKEIVLDSGVKQKATLNHPMLVVTPKGKFVWKKVSDLTVGDKLVTRAGDNVYGDDVTVFSPSEAYLIGALIADGYLGQKYKLNFSTDNLNLLHKMENYFKELTDQKVEITKRDTSNGYEVTMFDTAKVEDWHERLGIPYGVAKDKEVPQCILESPKFIQLAFISGYLESEMSIDVEKVHAEVTSASTKLLRQLQLMLKNMGVLSTIKSKSVKSYVQNDYVRLGIRSKYIAKLLPELTLHTEQRKQQRKETLEVYGVRPHRPFKESIPNGRELLYAYRDSLGVTGKDRKRFETPPRSNIGQDRAKKLLHDFPEGDTHVKAEIENLMSNEYYFDPIVEINDRPKEPTFDVHMPRTHSFIAESIVNHNTEIAGGFIKEIYNRLEPGETIAFFTMSKEIFNQTHKRLEERLGIPVGKYGSGKKDLKKVNVVMVPTISAGLKIDPEKGVKLTPKERVIKKMAKDIAPTYGKGVNQKQLLKAFLMNFEIKTKADQDLVYEIDKIIYESESDAKVRFKLNGYKVKYEKILEKKNEKKLKKKKEVVAFLETIVAFVSDEHQHISADSLYNTLLACTNAIYRIGLSGSIDQKDKMLLRRMEAVTGTTSARTTTEFLVQEGHSAKPYITITSIFGVEQNTETVNISGLKDYQQVYENGIVRNDYRNKLIAKITEMCYNEGKGILIIINRIEHGETLSRLMDILSIPHMFLHGEIEDAEREAKLRSMREGELKVMIATSIMDEGVDISGIDVLILGAGGKSLRQTVQRVGRAIRKKKGKENKAQVFDFYDRTHDYLFKHSKARIKIYEEENFDITFIE